MATWYRKISGGNWSDANGWNSLANGTGTDASHPLPAADTADLNAKTCVLDVDVTIALITSSADSGYLTASSGTRTINGSIIYSATATSGMLRPGTGRTIIVNGSCTNSSSGRLITSTSTGAVTISNAGSNAIVNTGSGICVDHSGSGALNVTGAVSCSEGTGISIGGSSTNTITGNLSQSGSSNSVCLYSNASGATTTVDGEVSCTSATASSGVDCAAGTVTVKHQVTSSLGKGIRCRGGTVNLEAVAESSGTGIAISCESGTVNWTGTKSISSDCYISQTGGTFNAGTSGNSLSVEVGASGSLVVYKTGGSFNQVYCTILLGASGAKAASIPSGTITVTGPTIPAAADVRYNVARGYPGDAVGALEMPNSGTPTGAQDATSDACVVSGKKYGSPQRTGSATGGTTPAATIGGHIARRA